ncbi:MAG: response regulator [Chloroflexi bacterium]|nr:response regulator [Chloroflexota bacterium]
MPHKPRILVVDDDADLVDSLRLVLEASSYEVSSAGSSEDAMLRVERARPDLILLDIMMPEGTEGFHFVWNLRSHRKAELREIPIIVLTSIHRTTTLRFNPVQGDADYRPGEFLPVQAFLDKPVAPGKLLEHVSDVLARGPSRGSPAKRQSTTHKAGHTAEARSRGGEGNVAAPPGGARDRSGSELPAMGSASRKGTSPKPPVSPRRRTKRFSEGHPDASSKEERRRS